MFANLPALITMPLLCNFKCTTSATSGDKDVKYKKMSVNVIRELTCCTPNSKSQNHGKALVGRDIRNHLVHFFFFLSIKERLTLQQSFAMSCKRLMDSPEVSIFRQSFQANCGFLFIISAITTKNWDHEENMPHTILNGRWNKCF